MGSGRILGIESACDETAAAVVERGALTRSSIVASQIATHAPYGGVVPELASREHLRNIVPITRAALAQAGCGLSDLDGFYTFVVGTESGFAVLRDPISCKPAVMAETDDYVAFGSEYRALAGLPSIDQAKVFEPEPATVYAWER